MEQATGSLLSIAILMIVGYVLAKRGWLGERAIEGLKKLITNLTLPLLLFRAFLQLRPDGRNILLAAGVFTACAAMGLVGALLARVVHTPRPETRLLFQGFEAGMLGYALYAGYHGSEHLPAFAALDLGQVLYVFTVLMAQMSLGAGAGSTKEKGVPNFPWRDIARSKVLWAIGVGILLSLLAPAFSKTLAVTNGTTSAIFDTIGGLTTPLVCLVIGASLSAGIVVDKYLIRVVAARAVVAAGMGLVFAYMIVPALGFSDWHARAAMMLFVLPPPFVIPVYYRGNERFVGSVLTLFTLVSVALIAVFAMVGVA
jgi:hypothetical protein